MKPKLAMKMAQPVTMMKATHFLSNFLSRSGAFVFGLLAGLLCLPGSADSDDGVGLCFCLLVLINLFQSRFFCFLD